MKAIAVTVTAALALFAAAADLGAQVKNYEAPGNLESRHDLGCVGSAKLRNTYTPPDLYRALARCVEQGTYGDAVFLYVLAGVYGRYDTQRVADTTAHQAITVLHLHALGPLGQDRQDALRKALKDSLGAPGPLAAVCKEIVRIGRPDYHPRYMIQHGMGAFRKDGPSDRLTTPFDAAAAWTRALDNYLHCPGL